MGAYGVLNPAGKGNYPVEDGDSIESIAFKNGFFPETLWHLPENADLAAARKDRNVLLPGDLVYVPKPRLATYAGSTDHRYRFRRKGVPAKFRLQVLDDAIPLAGASYVFTYKGFRKDGTLDGSGHFEEFIPPDLAEASLLVKSETNTLRYRLRFGFLYPIESMIGVKQRLANLGYYRDRIDGEPALGLAAAIADFQRDYQMTETGELSPDTVAKLLEVHDSR